MSDLGDFFDDAEEQHDNEPDDMDSDPFEDNYHESTFYDDYDDFPDDEEDDGFGDFGNDAKFEDEL